jgi:hypothetical protein
MEDSSAVADELLVNRFVIAIFPNVQELAVGIKGLFVSGLGTTQLLVVAPADVAPSLPPRGLFPLENVPMTSLPARGRSKQLSIAFADLLEQFQTDTPEPIASRLRQEPIYALLPRELAEGAFVLILHVDDAEQQQRGARILLNGHSKCVLTHDMRERVDATRSQI